MKPGLRTHIHINLNAKRGPFTNTGTIWGLVVAINSCGIPFFKLNCCFHFQAAIFLLPIIIRTIWRSATSVDAFASSCSRVMLPCWVTECPLPSNPGANVSGAKCAILVIYPLQWQLLLLTHHISFDNWFIYIKWAKSCRAFEWTRMAALIEPKDTAFCRN